MTRLGLWLWVGLTTPLPRRGAPWLAASALTVAFACSPSASTVPLGLGPLAVAERDAQAEAEAQRRKRQPKPARRSAVAAAPAKESPAQPEAAKAEPSDKGAQADKTAGTDAAGAGATPSFEGLFAGEDIAVYRFTGFPDREERDDKAKIRIEKASGGNVSIIVINTADGSDMCELMARVDGNAALIESAQPCFSGGEGSVQGELTSGRAVIEGDRLKMTAEGTLSLVLPDQELDGEMTYTFEGERE